jgi:hypothetical protein
VAVVRRHPRHFVSKEGLPDFVVDADPLQASRERMAQIVKMEIDEFSPRTDRVPILAERSRIIPPPEDSLVAD